MLKRSFDFVVAACALLLLLPLFALVALAIYRHDRGPVCYRQVRVGLGGAAFSILKFRSMVLNADKLGGYSTAENDARITPVGRFIRRTSIDELPQLLNVLLGEMSLVGPRPDVPAQRQQYTDAEWRLRHTVLPGITGLAQATYRSWCTEQQRKDMDLDYVARRSFMLDLKIISMTVKQLVSKGGN